jgi:hypothetical protein
MNKQPTQGGMNINIDIKSTQPIVAPNGNQVFTEGVILRKVSKFVAGTPEDAVIPVPCFFDPTNGHVLVEMLPKELREEYETYNKERGE